MSSGLIKPVTIRIALKLLGVFFTLFWLAVGQSSSSSSFAFGTWCHSCHFASFFTYFSVPLKMYTLNFRFEFLIAYLLTIFCLAMLFLSIHMYILFKHDWPKAIWASFLLFAAWIKLFHIRKKHHFEWARSSLFYSACNAFFVCLIVSPSEHRSLLYLFNLFI